LVVATGICAMFALGLFVSSAPWLARESIFEFTARAPTGKNLSGTDAAPSADREQPQGNSEQRG